MLLRFLLFFLLLYFFVRPIYLAFLYTRPPRLRISFFTPTSLGVAYSDVTLTSQDGVDLRGWYVHSRNEAAVLLLHGHSGNRLATLHQAEALIRAGYGVLMMDLRAHGHSGGRRFARSAQGVGDVLTAVSYLANRPEVNAAGIGVYGVSDGGLFALQAAAKTVAIRAAAVDGPSPALFADFPPPVTVWQRLFAYPLQRFYLQAVDWFSKQPPLDANMAIIKKIGPRPLFFISTGRQIERNMVRRLYEGAAEPKAIWEIPQARHANGWQTAPDLYDHNLVQFFDGALVSTRHREVAPATFEPRTGMKVREQAGENYEVIGEATISFLWANVIALLLLPLAFFLFFWPYQWIWGAGVLDRVVSLNWLSLIALFLLFGAGIVVHEWIHGVAFVRIGGVAKTAVRYGFSWKGMAPFAHCQAPMRAAAYRWSVVLPGIVLGVLPAVLGIIFGAAWLVVWGTMMVVAAGGDTAVLIAMGDLSGDQLVLDHPTQAGCLIIKDQQS